MAFDSFSAEGLTRNGVAINGHAGTGDVPDHGGPQSVLDASFQLESRRVDGQAMTWPAPEAEFQAREQVRLEMGIAEARHRAAQARTRARDRDAQLAALVEAETQATMEMLDAMQLDHDRAISAMREQARAEAESILDDAKLRAQALRAELDRDG